ncbi:MULTISPECIES: 4'-phosphopantetheinyl transferase superfamily protein [unclassified Lysobacter]|uniref:4'-phosphopantetheinyl transferase family protein n=1 Tax=unclassified Lysobacter TaxID=2635362 RepID=UPI001BE5B049|nr:MULTISPECIES: 4'-phosphopantetheinyl transferase superfamily protein [unclassified Lysobacter]MBT2744866.1 4'-phosphopantetheinyl transferase superfamily protein [Lysobacter sp. ISL-42]MBT2752141.1 4'-phosphopantetheinyl transferase superfamily protein [Lysobacter sp. ISL-50]MBT2778638.1 4'-phosphopantetheinyl transferase superfamily protein [Lysobacter sp. ISL-54]MBT2780431.1 4'-phosphopantetheinyl transferase superfamily protein [Lysobacter sp. ISL-52]
MSAPISVLATAAPARFSEANRSSIDVWLTYYDEIVDDGHLFELRKLLSDEEVAQEGRFYFADDRKRYLVTRSMVRTLLSRYAPIAPKHWEFSKNAYGRPMIANSILEARDHLQDLSFNISHTRGLIALAVSRDRDLGIDVEHISRRQICLDIAQRYFAPSEVADLSCVPPARQQDRFFEYWTFKESYIKARSMGLSLPLDGFSFQFPHHRAVRIKIDPELRDDAERWSLWQYRPTTDYLLAICAERGDGAPPCVSMRKFTPLVGEVPLSARHLRSSEPC